MMSTEAQRELIFDLGVNHGEDTQFYLDKGFRVVGVEADPVLAERLRKQFAREIADGRFLLEAVGVVNERGTQKFYRNITCDHWSSFDPSYGCRGNTEYEIIDVECVVFEDLIVKHGCPYYLKVDIGGRDKTVLAHLVKNSTRPVFLSVEEFDLDTINSLYSLGYNMFSLRPQQNKAWAVLPNPPREGNFVEREFTQRDSGPFGREVPQWMAYESAQATFHRLVRSEDNRWLPPPGEWYDLHATYWPQTIDDQSLDLME
jgi:FkbM family methyltransferase